MPRAGYLSAQVVMTERISGVVGTIAQTPSNSTIGVYDGTINSNVFGSIIGGFYFQTRQLQELDSVSVTGIQFPLNGSIISVQVVGFGRGLGTLYGTIIGTVIPDSNYVLAKAYQMGTLGGGAFKEPPNGTAIIGTLSLLETGR